MARNHGRILVTIWNDKDFRALPRTAQTLYIQLVTQPNINNAGVLPLMVEKWALACDEMTPQDVLRDLAILVDRRFIVIDTAHWEAFVRSFMRHDGVAKQPNVFKNALSVAQTVESPVIRRELAAELRRIGRADACRTADILDPSGAHSNPMPNPSATLREELPEPFGNPSETHPEGFETSQNGSPATGSENHRSETSETLSEPFPNPSADSNPSGTLREPFPEPCGVGEGVGVIANSPFVGGGVTRAHARTREGAPAREAEPTTAAQPIPSNGEPPAPWCTRHPGGTTDPCRACATAREDRARFDAEQPRRAAKAESERARQVAEDRARAITHCPLCDDDGYVGTVLCDHDPGTSDRARRGMAAVRAAMAARPGDHTADASAEENPDA